MKNFFLLRPGKIGTKVFAEGKALLFETIKIVILAAIIVLPIRYLIFQPFFVQGMSMEPNFESGDYLIIDEITYRFRDPKRGEVVVFKYPKNPSQRYIKRIIGLPKETIEIKDGEVIVYSGTESQALDETDYLSETTQTSGNIRVSLDEDEYFVLGDNRTFSSDSRRWGALPRKNIVGMVFLRAWPVAALAKFEAPAY